MKRNPWLPVVVVTLIILTLTSIPRIPQPQTKIHFLDKIAHFIVYFLWGYSITFVWKIKNRRSTLAVLTVASVILLFPSFDELHQYLIPSRNPSILDWLADLAGATAGFAIFSEFRIRGRRM